MTHLDLIQTLLVWALPVLFAVTLHEVAHGWAARCLGDQTAHRRGRLSLNPIDHVDPFGTVLIPTAMLLVGGFIFGWGRPVPVAAANLANPRRHMAIIALAGPVANLAMAIGWGGVIKLANLGGVMPLVYMGVAGVLINFLIMSLNLLPIPPLDGGRVVGGLLPERYARHIVRLEPYGLLVIAGLFVTGTLSSVLAPLLKLMEGLLTGLFGLHGVTF